VLESKNEAGYTAALHPIQGNTLCDFTGISMVQRVKLRPTRVFIHRHSRLELTCWKCAEIDIYSHLQTLSKNVFIRADYAFSALETILFV